jgi:hypothetical protein
LKVLQLRTPTPDTEHKFENSFNSALDHYKLLLSQVKAGSPPNVPDDNFDTGDLTPPGMYFMNDDVHAKLIEALAKQNFSSMTPELHAELQRFYANPNAPYATRRKPKEWAKLQLVLQQFKNAPAPQVTADASSLSLSDE